MVRSTNRQIYPLQNPLTLIPSQTPFSTLKFRMLQTIRHNGVSPRTNKTVAELLSSWSTSALSMTSYLQQGVSYNFARATSSLWRKPCMKPGGGGHCIIKLVSFLRTMLRSCRLCLIPRMSLLQQSMSNWTKSFKMSLEYLTSISSSVRAGKYLVGWNMCPD